MSSQRKLVSKISNNIIHTIFLDSSTYAGMTSDHNCGKFEEEAVLGRAV
jgi:hypothetical protein